MADAAIFLNADLADWAGEDGSELYFSADSCDSFGSWFAEGLTTKHTNHTKLRIDHRISEIHSQIRLHPPDPPDPRSKTLPTLRLTVRARVQIRLHPPDPPN